MDKTKVVKKRSTARLHLGLRRHHHLLRTDTNQRLPLPRSTWGLWMWDWQRILSYNPKYLVGTTSGLHLLSSKSMLVKLYVTSKENVVNHVVWSHELRTQRCGSTIVLRPANGDTRFLVHLTNERCMFCLVVQGVSVIVFDQSFYLKSRVKASKKQKSYRSIKCILLVMARLQVRVSSQNVLDSVFMNLRHIECASFQPWSVSHRTLAVLYLPQWMWLLKMITKVLRLKQTSDGSKMFGLHRRRQISRGNPSKGPHGFEVLIPKPSKTLMTLSWSEHMNTLDDLRRELLGLPVRRRHAELHRRQGRLEQADVLGLTVGALGFNTCACRPRTHTYRGAFKSNRYLASYF